MNSTTLQSMVIGIESCRVIVDIRPQMLEKVIENWTSRLDYIRASRGSPMPEIIFKICESRSFFRVHTGYFSNIPKCIKAEFIASWACSQSSVVSSSQR
ncbi:hypothetical protein TNCV_1678751 [Trichonephila clavipes]|nr:hypothetical protein TNCV_1678751 [Trichonephila clavipes]